MYPIAYRWISEPTPVTTIAIVIDSGSTRRSRATLAAPARIHSATVTTCVRSSAGNASRSSSAPSAIANDAAIAAVANHPAQRPSRAPNSMFTAAASSGIAIARPIRSIIRATRSLGRRRSSTFVGTRPR